MCNNLIFSAVHEICCINHNYVYSKGQVAAKYSVYKPHQPGTLPVGPRH